MPEKSNTHVFENSNTLSSNFDKDFVNEIKAGLTIEDLLSNANEQDDKQVKDDVYMPE